MKKIAILMLISASLMQSPAMASLSDAAHSDRYIVRAPARLAQGIVDVAFCWIPLFREPYRAAKSSETSFVDGLFRGIGYPVSYLFLGAWDIITFWAPGEFGDEAGMATRYNVFEAP